MNLATYFSDKSPSSAAHQYKAINKTITSLLHAHCPILKITGNIVMSLQDTSNNIYEGWNFKSGNYLFTTDTK